MSPSRDAFSSTEVRRIAGCTYRELDYWTRSGLVTPSIRDASGSGTQRRYSLQDAVTLRAIKALRSAGLSLQGIRRAARYLSAEPGPPAPGLTLMSDGSGLFATYDSEAVLDMLRSGNPVFALSLDRIRADVEKAAERRPRRRVLVAS